MRTLENGNIEYTINVGDTETTGFEPPPNGDIVEIAATGLRVIYDPEDKILVDIRLGKTMQHYADPGCTIGLEAMAIHGITPKILTENKAEPARIVKEQYASLSCDFWAFHNASFDRKFFNPPGARWICTLKAARVIIPEAPSHKNQILRYFLNLDNYMVPERMGDAHRAGFDTYVTALLLTEMIKRNVMHIRDMASLYEKAPDEEDKIAFGKHKGTVWSKIPKDYLQWLRDSTNQADIRARCVKILGS